MANIAKKMDKMQDYEALLEKIYELLIPFVDEGVELREESQVEDEYDISIPLNILPDVQTVKDFVEQLQKLVGS